MVRLAGQLSRVPNSEVSWFCGSFREPQGSILDGGRADHVNLALGRLSLWEIPRGGEAEQQGKRWNRRSPALDNIQMPPGIQGKGLSVHPGSQGSVGNRPPSWLLRPPFWVSSASLTEASTYSYHLPSALLT